MVFLRGFGLAREERLPAVLLLILFATLCFAGGASREDVLAQSVIRACAVVVMLIQVVAGRLPHLARYRACAMFLGIMIALAVVQLIPLPPAMWSVLPGRTLIVESPVGVNGWRPLNIVPDAGWNALFSLLVPLSVLVLMSSLEPRTARRALYLLIGAVAFSATFALLQAVGVMPENPLINGSTTDYAGVFANRNHQALLLAIGIAVAWFWGFQETSSRHNWRVWIAICIVILSAVTILVTGSRSGAVLGAGAIIASPIAARTHRKEGKQRVLDTVLWPAISFVIIVGVLLLSTYFGRAASLSRASTLVLNEEFRLRSLPVVWEVAKAYFPFGAGLGSFDAVYRIAEPLSLLEPTYFNHAHNDFLETVIETGIFGPMLLLGIVIWVGRRTFAAFSQFSESARMGRLGALIVALVLAASLSDYPARTPMMMAVLVIAGCWLTGSSREVRTEPA